MTDRFFILASVLAIVGLLIVYGRQNTEIEKLHHENACLIRVEHIGTAAFATIGKNGHAHVVYKGEDCTK